MKEYKVIKEIRYQAINGDIKIFGVGQKITQKDLLNSKQLNGFIVSDFMVEDKKKEVKKDEKAII